MTHDLSMFDSSIVRSVYVRDPSMFDSSNTFVDEHSHYTKSFSKLLTLLEMLSFCHVLFFLRFSLEAVSAANDGFKMARVG